MRLVLFQIAAFVLVPCSLQAQTADLAPPMDDLASAAPQQNPVQPASVLDFPIEKIADMSGGCAILDRDFPGLRAHPMYPFFKAMTLNQIAAMSKGQITPDMLAQARTDLTAIDTAASPQAAVHVAATPVAAMPASATVTTAIK
jgi:hypothetical protein